MVVFWVVHAELLPRRPISTPSLLQEPKILTEMMTFQMAASGRMSMSWAPSKVITPLFLSGKHWSLVQRYFSQIFVIFRRSTVRSIVIHELVLLLLTIL
jgi:hypothetical protein